MDEYACVAYSAHIRLIQYTCASCIRIHYSHIYVCMYTFVFVCMYYVYVDVYVYVHIYICNYIYTYTLSNRRVHVQSMYSVYIRVCIYTYISLSLYIYKHIYAYMLVITPNNIGHTSHLSQVLCESKPTDAPYANAIG